MALSTKLPKWSAVTWSASAENIPPVEARKWETPETWETEAATWETYNSMRTNKFHPFSTDLIASFHSWFAFLCRSLQS